MAYGVYPLISVVMNLKQLYNKLLYTLYDSHWISILQIMHANFNYSIYFDIKYDKCHLVLIKDIIVYNDDHATHINKKNI